MNDFEGIKAGVKVNLECRILWSERMTGGKIKGSLEDEGSVSIENKYKLF